MMNKNNESINKYVAGYFDGNGTIYLRFDKGKIRLGVELCFNLEYKKAEETMLELYDHYDFGVICRKTTKNNVRVGYWCIYGKQAISFINRIKKHLVVKGTHSQRILKLYTQITKENRRVKPKVLKRWLRLSRRNTCSLKHKNHFTWAWLAGYIDADGYIGYNPKIYTGIRFGANAIKDRCAIELISKSTGRQYRFEKIDNTYRLDIYMSKNNIATANKYLPKLIKHLRIKKWNAEQLIHHIRTHRD